MNKITTFLAGIALVLLLGIACNKDENPDNDKPTEEKLALEGSWQVESVDFLDAASVEWPSEIPYNFGTKFGYAPYMYTIMKGYVFNEDKIENDSIDGYAFDFILEQEFGDPGVRYWYWNYIGEDGLEIIQLNVPNGPPNNFSIMNGSDAEMSEDGNSVTFKAEMFSRIPGGKITDVKTVPVEINLKKGEIEKSAEVFIEGEPFKDE